MKNVRAIVPILLVLLFLSGCYNAKVSTGLEPSNRVVEESFASSWIYGLVPPKTVKTAEECTNGVAMVETKLSFINMLVGTLTGGIYTPMYIKVTCATGMGSADIPGDNTNRIEIARNSTDVQIHDAFVNAANRAVKINDPVYVVFE